VKAVGSKNSSMFEDSDSTSRGSLVADAAPNNGLASIFNGEVSNVSFANQLKQQRYSLSQ
jgi:hypothetical protein